MVSLGLDVTYQDLESEPVRSASHAINEVFANE